MAFRTRTLALAVVACSAVALPSGAPASDDVHAAAVRARAKPRVGDPHTKMAVLVTGFKDIETVLATQTLVRPSGSTERRKFRFNAGSDGTLEVNLKRPQAVGSYEFCFKGRAGSGRACAKYRVVPEEG